MATDLRRVSKIGRGDLPFERSTLYKWRHTNKFPGLFVKCAGALFVDVDRLNKILEAGRVK